MIYELLGIANSNDPELVRRAEDSRLSDMTWVASVCLERGDVTSAARHYREILKLFPNDTVAKAILCDLSPSLQPEMPNQGGEE